MIKKVSVFIATIILLAVIVIPTSAITGNYSKDFDHPFVGLAVFYDQDGQFYQRCSGSLLSPTVFLTAGHCVEPVFSARVFFQQDAGTHYDPVTQLDLVSGYPEYCAAGTEDVCTTSHQFFNYGWPAGFPNTRDVGLLILDNPIYVSEYGILPDAGFLEDLDTRRGDKSLIFTDSGYGLSYTNPAITVSFRERLMAQAQLVNLRSALTAGYNLQTTNNPGIGGGTCFGDSGGPVFYGNSSSNLIVGITSFGPSGNVCVGVDFAYRTDQAELINWVQAHMP